MVKELWEQGIIFSENFVKSIKDAYKNRTLNPLFKKDIIKYLTEQKRISGVSTPKSGVSYGRNPAKNENDVVSTLGNPQSKVKETIVNQTIENESIENKTSSAEIIENKKNDDDDFFNKFFFELSLIKDYPTDEDLDKQLLKNILEVQPIKDKILKLVKLWSLRFSENPVKPRERLYGWVVKNSEDEIKDKKEAEAKVKREAENQAVAKEIDKLDEEINNLKSVDEARNFLQENVEKPSGIFKFLPPYAKEVMSRFGLTQIEVWG